MVIRATLLSIAVLMALLAVMFITGMFMYGDERPLVDILAKRQQAVMDWLALGVAALAAAMLLVGVVTGRMPNAVIEPSRDSNPYGFWGLGSLYAMVAVGCLMIALHPFP